MRSKPPGRKVGDPATTHKFPSAILLLFFSAFGFTWPAKSAPSPLVSSFDPASFAEEMTRLRNNLDSSKNSPEKLRALRESLPQEWEVEAGARRFGVPSGVLASKLQAAERTPSGRAKNVEEARDYLAALAQETSSLSAEPAQDAEPARARLRAILARPEFASRREPSLLDRLRARINELLLQALERILSRVGGAKSLGNVLLWAAICGAAIFIGYWIFRRWFRAARMEEMALHAAALPVRTWQEWIFSAREAAAHGDYRMAVHCAYWAGIVRLQEIGTLPADRSKTPREYLRALSQPGRVVGEEMATRRRALATLTGLLEKFWYGCQTASEPDFRDSLTHLEALGCRLP